MYWAAGADLRGHGRARKPDSLVGIDKKFQSFSFFCCSLYIGDPGVFVKKVSVCVSAACRTEKWLETFLWVESKPKTH